ncbi:secretin N-terminal domain-containing protein [Thermodesulfobacteriota bacterium]
MKQQKAFIYRIVSWALLVLPTIILIHHLSLSIEVAVIKVKYRSASELMPIVQAILSPGGTVTLDERLNALVIVDKQDAIQRVHAYLDRFDRAAEQVRIRVRFLQGHGQESSAVDTRVRASGGHLRISTGGKKEDGIDLHVEDGNQRKRMYSEYFVTTTSGVAAYIQTGYEIPYRKSRYGSTGSHPAHAETVAFKTVNAGFEVTPTIVGNRVNLKIVPRVAYDNTKEGVIRFFGAQTEVTAPLGQWVEIGGTSGHTNETIREILSLGRSNDSIAGSISIMAERSGGN